MTKEKGFTLIEVAVVIGLIGIIISAAVPHLLNTSSVVNRAGHQELVSTIRLAQSLSYSSEQIIRMDIDSINHCYGLYLIKESDIVALSDPNSSLTSVACGKLNDDGDAAFQPLRTSRRGDLSNVIMDPQVRVNKNVQIYFLPNGQTIPAEIEFNVRQQTIRLDGQTGYITYED